MRAKAKERKAAVKKTESHGKLSVTSKQLLDQMLNPFNTKHRLGFMDQACSSFVRSAILVKEVTIPDNPDEDDTTIELMLRPDPIRFLGVASTSSENVTVQYVTAGSFRPGLDPVYGSSVATASYFVDLEQQPTSLLYGGIPAGSSVNAPIRFMVKEGTNYGPLQGSDGSILASDGQGVIDFGPGTPPTGIRYTASYQLDATSEPGKDSTMYVWDSNDGVTWSVIDTQIVTNPSYSEIFESTIALSKRYLKFEYNGRCNADVTRSIIEASMSITLSGPKPHSYDFDPIPDLKQLMTMGDSFRMVGMALWVQFTGNLTTAAGVAAGKEMAALSAGRHSEPWSVEDLSTEAGTYIGKSELGLYGIWCPKGVPNRRFFGWGLSPPNPNVLVAALSGLQAGASYRITALACYECESTKLIAGPVERVEDEQAIEAAVAVLSAAMPNAFTENPLHEDVINGIKSAASWVWGHRGDIAEGVATAGKISAAILPFLL